MRVIQTDGIGGWVTTKHAARYFGVGQAAIERAIQRGKLAACVLGHTYLVRLADLLALEMKPVVRDEEE